MKEPYQQGTLDGMCGFYSIINALHFLKPNLTTKKSEKLLQTMVKYKKQSFYRLYLEGTYFSTIHDLLKFTLKEKYLSNITYETPYSCDIFEDQYEFLSCLNEYFKYGNAAAIVSIGHPWNHWTVVTKINFNTEKISIFDSYRPYSTKQISFEELSLKKKKEKYHLFPHETIVLIKK